MRCGQESCTCEGDEIEEGEYCCEACAELAEAAPVPDEPRVSETSPSPKPCPCGHPGCRGARLA